MKARHGEHGAADDVPIVEYGPGKSNAYADGSEKRPDARGREHVAMIRSGIHQGGDQHFATVISQAGDNGRSSLETQSG